MSPKPSLKQLLAQGSARAEQMRRGRLAAAKARRDSKVPNGAEASWECVPPGFARHEQYALLSRLFGERHAEAAWRRTKGEKP